MSDANPFSTALGKFRSDTHLTQRSLAQAMGITDGNVSKIERGIVVPTMHFVDKMFDSLQMPKHGHWYEKFTLALAQSRPTLKINVADLSPIKIRFLLIAAERVKNWDDSLCETVEKSLPY